MKGLTIFATAALISICFLSLQSQDQLPSLKYSKEPAMLKGLIIGDSIQKVGNVKVMFRKKYHSGMGDAIKGKSVIPDEDGNFTLSLLSGTTTDCHLNIGDTWFSCYIVPGDTVSFTLDLNTLSSDGIVKALNFDGALADFNQDLVYAI